jgi:hypothetical protein
MLNFSHGGLFLDVFFGFSHESFSLGYGFFELFLLRFQDVGKDLLGVGDLSFAFIDQIVQSSDFGIVLIGSSLELVISIGVFGFKVINDFLNSVDQSIDGSLGHQVHFSQSDHVSSPGAGFFQHFNFLFGGS